MEQDLKVEPSAIELVSPDSTREEIAEIYCDVYLLQKLLGGHSVMRRYRSISSKRFWIPSRNASGISGFLHCWGRD